MNHTGDTVLDDAPMRLCPGDGIVCRAPGALAAVVPRARADSGWAEEIVRLVRSATTIDGHHFFRQAIAAMSKVEPDEGSGVCIIAEVRAQIVLLVQGPMDVTIRRPGADDERIAGDSVLTWIERVVEVPFAEVEVVGREVASDQFDPLFELQAGVVTGGGFRLEGAAGTTALSAVPEPVVRSAPTTDVEPARPFRAVLLAPVEAEASAAAPLPLADTGASPAPVEGVVVVGLHCSRGHFNNPESRFCGHCGISMIQQTHNPVEGVRPPLGYVVLDDGATFSLDRSYIVGRDPHDHDDVHAGRARPLVLTDPGRNVSRAHASIELVGWDVHVADLGSTNGTFVAQPGEGSWARVPLGEPALLLSGARVLIGTRTLEFDSHHKP